MSRERQRSETPPVRWTPTQAVDDPILNSPYEEPTQHWVYQGGVPSRMSGRRPASYWYKTKRTGAAAQEELFREESRDDLPLVNALRADVKRWRESGFRGASSVTKELLAWWIRDDRPRRLFFCQQEAVETIIYLLEMALPGRLSFTQFKNFMVDEKNIEKLVKGALPDFENLKEDYFPRLIDVPSNQDLLPLLRLGCKMATGSGKTIVMAMLIVWAFCNRGRNPSSTHYPNGVLVCAPNLTVKKRLQVLMPEDPDNYYDQFELIPSKYREFMNTGKVLIANWHAFAPKSEHAEGGKSYAVVNKGEETNDAFTKDRLKELAQRLPILVLNDEGHHCWRGKSLNTKEERELIKDLTKEEKDALNEEAEEARVWLAGLDRINNCGLVGMDESGRINLGILACVDLSATPFYLANSGYPEGSPFPWIVNDFGLVDAIESGITKIPRLPVMDDSGGKDEVGRPDPKFFRLWEKVKDDLKSEDFISKTKAKPESIYKYAESALLTLASQWKIQFDKYKEDASDKPFIPPVLIVVCNNTEVADIFFRKISGEEEIETVDESGKTITIKRYDGSGVMPELANSEKEQHTIRIDSKLLAKIETEGAETKDQAALRLREIIDTVGKRGGSGEHVRCVVSVSMLTEGWDANNVTHILGVRAFDSQLLCEQVVGRGLRRMSYLPDPETGLLAAESVDVYGIPFSLIPFKGKSKESDGPDPVYKDIFAVPERAEFEIRMPNVESYVYALREGGIRCDVESLEGFIVDKEPSEVYLAPTMGYQDEAAPMVKRDDFVKQTREEYYKSIRPQQIYFQLSQMILEDLMQGAQKEKGERGKIKFLARHQLFPEILKIVTEYVDEKVQFKPGVDKRELGLERYAQLLRERIRDGILPAAARDDAKLLPVLNSFQPFTTTDNVNYRTTRPVVDLEKSHINRAMIQSDWEKQAIAIMEELDAVEFYTPNDRQIGLIVPYEYEGHHHNYEPDFIVKLQNDMFVLLEIKGGGGEIRNPDQVLAKNAAAKKWVAAVNNLGRYGQWVFEICRELDKLRTTLLSHAGIPEESRPFKIFQSTPENAWKDCVPLTTLQMAAGSFSEDQVGVEEYTGWGEEWVSWEGHPKFDKGMFVARIRGKSMEPDIPDGSYCLFRPAPAGTRQGKTVLVWHSGVTDPHTGGQYTVKVYESEKRGSEEGEWEHVRITLKPRNPEYLSIVLEPKEEGEVRVIGEFVQVVGC